MQDDTTKSLNYYTAKEIAKALGVSKKTVFDLAKRDNWPPRKRAGRGGPLEYPLECLPLEAREALAEQTGSPARREGEQEGKKLALAEKNQKQAARKDAEAGLQGVLGLRGSEKQRHEDRFAIVDDWGTYRKVSGKSVKRSMEAYALLYNQGQRPGMEEIRKRIRKISARTLMKWRNILKTKGHLGAEYGNKKGSGKIDSQPDVKDFVEGMLITKPHASASLVLKALDARFPKDADLPSQGRLAKWMNRWKTENAMLFSACINPDQYKDSYMAAFGSASEDVVYLNQRWEFDGTPADLMLTDGRHHLCGVIDVFSRRARLLVTPTAKATAVAGLLRRSILDWGLPPEDWGLTAKTDNGSDYVGHHMTRVFKSLKIIQKLCPPFSPWHKPHIERFFRTFSHDLVELAPGYIGHDVAERQAIEARKAFSERLFKKDQVIDVAMSSEDLQAFCDEWVNNIYQHAPHEGLHRKTPFQVANEWQEPVRRISNERALDLLLAEAPGNGGKRTVSKKGLRLDNGLYIAPELWAWIGDEVLVLYDPVDQGRVAVYSLGDDPRFICIAEDPDRTGIDRAEVAAKARELQTKTIQEAKAELKRTAKRLDIDHIADEIRAHKACEAAKIIELPKQSTEFTTPALDAAAQAAEALDGPKPERDKTAFLAGRLQEIREKEAELAAAREENPRSDREAYLEWCEMDRRRGAGEELNEQEERTWRSFQMTAVFRTQQRMAEDFAEFYADAKN